VLSAWQGQNPFSETLFQIKNSTMDNAQKVSHFTIPSSITTYAHEVSSFIHSLFHWNILLTHRHSPLSSLLSCRWAELNWAANWDTTQTCSVTNVLHWLAACSALIASALHWTEVTDELISACARALQLHRCDILREIFLACSSGHSLRHQLSDLWNNLEGGENLNVSVKWELCAGQAMWPLARMVAI
jgi:hypothetical protein